MFKILTIVRLYQIRTPLRWCLYHRCHHGILCPWTHAGRRRKSHGPHHSQRGNLIFLNIVINQRFLNTFSLRQNCTSVYESGFINYAEWENGIDSSFEKSVTQLNLIIHPFRPSTTANNTEFPWQWAIPENDIGINRYNI